MSVLKADTIQSTGGGAATLTKQAAAKIWANIDQTSTQSINDSFQVSSVTDNGSGRTEVSFTNSMSSVNYVVTTSSKDGGSYNKSMIIGADAGGAMTASAYELFHRQTQSDGSGSGNDANNAFMVVHGDLA